MRKINKIINIAIISILIGVPLGPGPAYAGETSLRVPLAAKDQNFIDKFQTAEQTISRKIEVVLTPKVFGETVGILRIIPDIRDNYKTLFDIKKNEIAAVDFYPTEDPTFARPMGIISCDEQTGLSHAMVRARFWRIPHAVISALDALKEYDGKWVYMNVSKEGAKVRLATKDEIEKYESYKPHSPRPMLSEVDLTTPNNILAWYGTKNFREVSHKFASLHLINNAVPQDSGYINWGPVIPFATYKRVLDANPGVEQRIQEIVRSINNEGINDIETKLAQVRDIIENMEIPEKIWGNAEKERIYAYTHDHYSKDWSIDYTIMNETWDNKGIFIRTGTNAEDLPMYPGFGTALYGTFPNIKRDSAKAYVKKAWASIWNLGPYLERRKFGIGHFSVYPAVQITQSINADYAFVIHTADPDEYNTDILVIEIVQGLGEGLVGDKCPGNAHRYVYSKKENRIIDFKPGTKETKIVLNEDGGTKIAPLDYTNDIFLRDRKDSKLALDLARASARIEKLEHINRPQDIEGAIEFSTLTNENYAVFIQSRSQVGYDSYPTRWEEFYKENIEWALDLIKEHRDKLTGGVEFNSLKNIGLLYELYCLFVNVSDKTVTEAEYPYWFAQRIRLFASCGEEGLAFAGKILLQGNGIHIKSIEAFGYLPPELKPKILGEASVDFRSLNKDGLECFKRTSNFTIARIIVSHKRKDLGNIFPHIEPIKFAYLLGEVEVFYRKDKNTFEEANIKVLKDEMKNIINGVVSQYSPEVRTAFIQALTPAARDWLGYDAESGSVKIIENTEVARTSL